MAVTIEHIEDLFPLSPLQEGMLFHVLSGGADAVYFEQMIWDLPDDLNAEAFERAWQALMLRHGVLRTGVVWQDLERPLQAVLRSVPLVSVAEDWRQYGSDEQERRLRAFVEEDRRHGFSLASPPLWRIALFHVSTGFKFVWSYHHLLLDGWSVARLMQEVSVAYDQLARGRDVDLPPVRPYRDYIGWLQAADRGLAERYWTQTLAGYAPVSVMGALEPPAAGIETPGYCERDLKIDGDTADRLQAWTRRHRLTSSGVAEAAWSLVLSTYSGARDLVFGSIVAGRPPTLPGADEMIGLFINTLPVRIRVDPSEPVVAWLQRLRDEATERRGFDHSRLVEIQTWSGLRGDQLFDTLFVFENQPVSGASREGTAAFGRPRLLSHHTRPGYPLSLVVLPTRPLVARAIFDAALCAPECVDRMLAHFAAVLDRISRSTDTSRVRDLMALPEAQRERLVASWRRPTSPFDASMTLSAVIESLARESPGAPAIRSHGRSLTYEALNRAANRVAHRLIAAGVGPEDVVGVLMERSPEYVIALLAVLKSGAAYLPLDPSLPDARLEVMLASARPRLVISGSDPIWSEAEQTDADTVSDPPCRVRPENLAYVMYTSGSTGTPKGVMICHAGLANVIAAQRAVFEVDRDDGVLQFASAAFDASVLEILLGLCSGATLCLPRPTLLAGPALASEIRQLGATTVLLPPSVLETLQPDDVSTLRTVIAGGERLPARLQSIAAQTRLFNAYGPTETTIWVTTARCVATDREPDIGVPIQNARLYVLDGELNPVPIAAPGELYVGGIAVGRGYLGRPDLTAERFVPDPFADTPGARMYRTGDKGRHLEDGRLAYLDRVDQQVKIRGLRIELGEIEGAAMTHPQVQRAAAVKWTDETGEARLALYVCAIAAFDATELRAFLVSRLPQYMVPAAIVFVTEWPLTIAGKLDRRRLPPPLPVPSTSAAPPVGELEQRIAAIWQELLKVDHVSRNANFFDLGGHSLLLIRAQDMLSQAFRRSIAIRDLFANPTVATLAAFLAEPETPETPDRAGGAAARAADRRARFARRLTESETRHADRISAR